MADMAKSNTTRKLLDEIIGIQSEIVASKKQIAKHHANIKELKAQLSAKKEVYKKIIRKNLSNRF